VWGYRSYTARPSYASTVMASSRSRVDACYERKIERVRIAKCTIYQEGYHNRHTMYDIHSPDALTSHYTRHSPASSPPAHPSTPPSNHLAAYPRRQKDPRCHHHHHRHDSAH